MFTSANEDSTRRQKDDPNLWVVIEIVMGHGWKGEEGMFALSNNLDLPH